MAMRMIMSHAGISVTSLHKSETDCSECEDGDDHDRTGVVRRLLIGRRLFV